MRNRNTFGEFPLVKAASCKRLPETIVCRKSRRAGLLASGEMIGWIDQMIAVRGSLGPAGPSDGFDIHWRDVLSCWDGADGSIETSCCPSYHHTIVSSIIHRIIVSLMIHRIVTEQFHLRDLTSTDRMFCTSGAFTRINLSGFKIQRCIERLRDRKWKDRMFQRYKEGEKNSMIQADPPFKITVLVKLMMMLLMTGAGWAAQLVWLALPNFRQSGAHNCTQRQRMRCR